MTGRTVQDFTTLKISSGGAMVDLKPSTLGEIGLDYPVEEVVAFVDACKGSLAGKPGFVLPFTCPLDNTVTTGAFNVLSAQAGLTTALSFDVQIGIQAAWTAGMPQFGMSAVVASNSGVWLSKFKVNGNMIDGELRLISGSAVIPAWGTAAEVVPA